MTNYANVSKGYETKMRIIGAMIELGHTASVEDMTVTDICRIAGVTRQTFYRHFDDKLCALRWYMRSNADEYVNVISNGLSWREAGLRLLLRAKEKQEFYEMMMREDAMGSGVNQDHRTLFLESYRENLRSLPNFDFTERLDFQLTSWVDTARRLVRQWVVKGCPGSPEKMADLIASCMPHELRTETEKCLV